MRCCISEKLSPPGKRNVDGARCTVCHSGCFISFASSAPVQSPKSHSSRPRSTFGRRPRGRGDRRRRLAGPLERRRVDGVDARQLADPLGGPLGLLAAGVGEVQAGRPAGQHLARRRRLAVADEQDRGRRGGRAVRVAMDGCSTYCRRPWIAGAPPSPAVPGRVLRPLRRASRTPSSTRRCGSSRTSTTGRSPRSAGCTPSSASTGDVLDLMSSWVSHFERPPAQPHRARDERRRAGPQPGRRRRPSCTTSTPIRACRSTTARSTPSTCCVSVDYLVRPVEVFADVARVLRPGGLFVCTFSNRCFPTKAIRGWLANDDRGPAGDRRRLLRAQRRLRPSRRSPTATPARRVTRCTPCGRPRRMSAGSPAVGGRRRRLPGAARGSSAWREQVAVEKRAAFRDETYWGRPVPGFGDPAARIVVLGLAPAAHGANRTGRVFTGDRSGDFLFRGDAPRRAGQPADVGPRRRRAAPRATRG